MTSDFRKKHKLVNKFEYRFYYDDSNKLLQDFKQYLVVQVNHTVKQAAQYAADLRQVWTSVDINRAIFPRNYLRDPDGIEDYFYKPLYTSLLTNLKLPKEEESPHIQASTIKSKLCSVNVFLRFVTNRGIFINLTTDDISRLTLKIQELCNSLRKSIDAREKIMSKIKSDTLITVENFQNFGSSEHVRKINEILKNMSTDKKGKLSVTKQTAIDIRDYLMVSLSYFNCLRASNLMNITIHDVKKTTKHEEIEDAFVLVNDEYKVSMIYGAKIILLDSILYKQLKIYIDRYRPLVSNDINFHDKKRYVFTSSRITTSKPLGQKMDHSAISNAMTSAFNKAKVLGCSWVSCSRIRMSVLTEIVSVGTENISNIASCFAKHSEKVCKKFYVQHFSEREAAWLSWSCYNMYKPPADIKKATSIRKTAIEKAKVPCASTIKKWLQDIINKIRLLTNITIEDKNIMKELEKLSISEDDGYLLHHY